MEHFCRFDVGFLLWFLGGCSQTCCSCSVVLCLLVQSCVSFFPSASCAKKRKQCVHLLCETLHTTFRFVFFFLQLFLHPDCQMSQLHEKPPTVILALANDARTPRRRRLGRLSVQRRMPWAFASPATSNTVPAAGSGCRKMILFTVCQYVDIFATPAFSSQEVSGSPCVLHRHSIQGEMQPRS